MVERIERPGIDRLIGLARQGEIHHLHAARRARRRVDGKRIEGVDPGIWQERDIEARRCFGIFLEPQKRDDLGHETSCFEEIPGPPRPDVKLAWRGFPALLEASVKQKAFSM